MSSGDKSELLTEAALQHHQPRLVLQFVEPRISTQQRILEDLYLCRVAISGKRFRQKTFVNAKAFPHVCLLCQNSGHLLEDCPGQHLPESNNLADTTAKNCTEI